MPYRHTTLNLSPPAVDLQLDVKQGQLTWTTGSVASLPQ